MCRVTCFEVDDVTFAELLAEGAIRPPTREELTLAEESGKFKKAAPPLVDYASKSEDDLKRIAASKGVDLSKAKTEAGRDRRPAGFGRCEGCVSAFDDAVDASFDDDNIGLDALWRPSGQGDGSAVRVVLKTPQEIVGVRDTQFNLPAVLIDVRVSEIAAPATGDTVEIVDTGVLYDVTGLSTLDSQGLVQTCEAAAS